jgi:hypothetical protein
MARERGARDAGGTNTPLEGMLHVYEAHHMDRQSLHGGRRVRRLLVRGVAHGRLR